MRHSVNGAEELRYCANGAHELPRSFVNRCYIADAENVSITVLKSGTAYLFRPLSDVTVVVSRYHLQFNPGVEANMFDAVWRAAALPE
jgi:hypothetical protein